MRQGNIPRHHRAMHRMELCGGSVQYGGPCPSVLHKGCRGSVSHDEGLGSKIRTDTTSTEDLCRIGSGFLCCACAVHLEEGDLTSELVGLLLVGLEGKYN